MPREAAARVPTTEAAGEFMGGVPVLAQQQRELRNDEGCAAAVWEWKVWLPFVPAHAQPVSWRGSRRAGWRLQQRHRLGRRRHRTSATAQEICGGSCC